MDKKLLLLLAALTTVITAFFVFDLQQYLSLGQFRISGGLIAVFVVLGVFPLIAKKVLERLKALKAYAP